MTPREEFDELRERQRNALLTEWWTGAPRHSSLWMRHHMLRRMAVLAALLFAVPAAAHDSWISRGGLRNGAGEWCCGEGDCFTIQNDAVQITAQGYRLFNREDVPFSEAQPSPDGQYWRCKRPDGSRRCFFAPPPNS